MGRHLSHRVDPVFLTCLRFLSAGIVLTAITALRRPSQIVGAIANHLPRMAFLGLTGIFGMGLLLFTSLRFTISVNSGILINANPIFIVLLAVFIGERVTFNKLFGILVGIIGCALVVVAQSGGSQRPPENNLLGCALAAGSAFCWAAYTVAGKAMVQKYGGMVTTTLATLIGAAMLLILLMLTQAPLNLEPDVLAWIAFVGIGPTALGFFLWYHALNAIEAGRLAPLQFIAPVGTAIIGRIALGEQITVFAIIGMLLVFLGIYCSAIRSAPAIEDGKR